MCETQRSILWLPSKWLEKPLEFNDTLDHDKTPLFCFFWREEVNILMWERSFCFKSKYISNSTMHKLTFDRCHKPAQHCDLCDRRRGKRNYTPCKYKHMRVQLERLKCRIPRSFISKLVLYISGPFSKFHSRPYARSVYRYISLYWFHKNLQFQGTNISHLRFS